MNGNDTKRSRRSRSHFVQNSASPDQSMVITPRKRRRSAFAADEPVEQALCLAGAIQEIQQACCEAGASVRVRSAVVTITLPGQTAGVMLNCADCLFGGFVCSGDSLIVPETSEYDVCFSLKFTASSAVDATFMVQSDGQNMANGVFKRMLSKTSQTVSGNIITQTNSGARLRIAVTSASPVSLTIQCGTFCVKPLC